MIAAVRFTCSPGAEIAWRVICREWRTAFPWGAGHDWGEYGPGGPPQSGISDPTPLRAERMGVAAATERALELLAVMSEEGELAVRMARRRLDARNDWEAKHSRCRIQGGKRWEHDACIPDDRADEMKEAVKEWLWHHVPLEDVPEPPLEMPGLPL